MEAESRKANYGDDGKILLELDNLCFNREFDYPSASVEEELNYLKGSETYIYLDNDKAIGFFSFKDMDSGEVELKSMAVIPEYQGKGIGRQMMDRYLRLNEGKDLFLVTHPLNGAAIILYLRSGFNIVGWKENYYGDGQPRLILKRKF